MSKGILLAILSCLIGTLFGQETYTAPESGQLSIEACSGTLYDSGGTGDYTNYIDSEVIINAPDGDILNLTFTEFDVENVFDNLSIYSGTLDNGTLIGSYSGSALPNNGDPIVVEGNVVTIVFTSDFTIVGAGFVMNWTCAAYTEPPVAAATYANFSCTGVVNFSDASNGFPNSWSWDFGDGNTSTAQNPEHTYAAAGNYTVSLTACNDYGCDTFTGTPVNYEPENEICTTQGTNLVNGEFLETQACNGVLFDPGGPSGDYEEGTYASITITPITASSITITFTEFDLGNQGEHTDMFYVYDPNTFTPLAVYYGDELPNNGAPITFDYPSIVIYFVTDHYYNYSGFSMYWEGAGSAEPPVASFSVENTSVPLNTPISFTDESTNNPGQWSWNFGDGSTSEEQNPSHVFTTPGEYEVNMTATNCNSSDAADPLTITVLSAPEITYNPESFNVTLESGTTLTEDLNICNVGEGPLVFNTFGGASEEVYGYSFSFTTNENGEQFSWALIDLNFQIIAENTQDYEANQTYTEQITGLAPDTYYYLLLNSPEGVQVLEEFTLFDPATGEVIYQTYLETGPEYYYYLPFATVGSFDNWLSLSNNEGTLEPNQCTDVSVLFDATELYAGVYDGTITINSNDINQSIITIPVTMNVTGAPQISVTPQDLDFGAVQVGAVSTLSFTIANDGSDDLSLAGLTSAESAFALSSASELTLAPGTNQMVNVSFTPTEVTNYNATITIENNAGDPVEVNLTASGVPSPSLTIDPDFFEVELIAGEDTTLVTNIGNVGSADLNYDISGSSDGTGFLFEFTTDFWGMEFSWTLTDDEGNVVLSSANEEYLGNTDYAVPLTGLSTAASYTLNLFDSFGDGALPTFKVTDLYSGATIIEGSFTAPENPSEMTLDLGSPTANLLDVDPSAGIVGINETQAVQIGIETEGMSTGTYNLDLTVATNDPAQPEANVDIILHVIAPVNADFAVSNTFACGQIPTLFSDVSENTPTSWTWYFGDGSTSEEQNPSYTYTEDGLYTVTLVACNSLGCDTLTRENYITVDTDCYSANIPGEHQSATITVCEGNVYDSGGPNGNYLEGNYGTLYIAPPGATQLSITFGSFNYEEHGDFLYVYDGPYGSGTLIGGYTGNDLEGVTLTATSGSLTLIEYTNHFNNYSGFEATFSCNDEPVEPLAAFSYQGNTGVLCSNEPILFFDQSTGNPTEWFWDFGDGVVSNQDNPVHVYTESGSYQVQLTTCNEIGCDTEIMTIDVEVDPDCIIEDIPGDFFGQTYITGCSGSLFDSGGSEGAHLEGSFGTVTIISPSPNLGIVFTEFDMSDEGFIAVYDGADVSAPLLGYFGGSDLPANGEGIFASGNVLTISEYTGGNPNANAGFALNYFCEQSFGNGSEGMLIHGGTICDGKMNFSTPESMQIDSWNWNFGDGTSSNAASLEHEFPHEGMFVVSLEACYQGDCNTYVRNVYSNKITPEISAPNLVTAGTAIDFYGLTENVTHWSWDFGNGEVADHNTPTMVYDTPGEYDIHIHMINMNVHETCDAEHTHRITIVDGIVSTEDLVQNPIKIYPNPATEVLNIDYGNLISDDVQINVFNMNGQLIKQWDFQNPLIDISDLASGTYLIELIIDNEAPKRMPFVKMK